METTETSFDIRIIALAKFLKCDPKEISETRWDTYENPDWEDTYETPEGEYMVLTGDEADGKAKEYILGSVWAFKPDFLAAHTPEGVDADIIRMIQDNDECESSNAKLRKLIQDEGYFVNDAIRSDGRAHFLNTYDGEEHEVREGEEYLYIYRVR